MTHIIFKCSNCINWY